MNKTVLAAGLGLTLPLLVIFALSFGKDPHKVASPLVGRNAPAFQLQPLGGGTPVSLASLKGTPVVVNFWATWCQPCVQEHHVLQRGFETYGKDVQFLGIVYEDTEDRIRDFLRRSGGAYPTLVDDAGKSAIAYGVYGVPETFFIDADGTIVAKHEGPLDANTLRGYLRKVMKR